MAENRRERSRRRGDGAVEVELSLLRAQDYADRRLSSKLSDDKQAHKTSHLRAHAYSSRCSSSVAALRRARVYFLKNPFKSPCADIFLATAARFSAAV